MWQTLGGVDAYTPTGWAESFVLNNAVGTTPADRWKQVPFMSWEEQALSSLFVNVRASLLQDSSFQTCWKFQHTSAGAFLVPDIQLDASGHRRCKAEGSEAHRVNVGSCFLTSSRRRSRSLRASLRAAWAMQSCDSRFCFCEVRSFGLVSSRQSRSTHNLHKWQVLLHPEKNQLKNNYRIQST